MEFITIKIETGKAFRDPFPRYKSKPWAMQMPDGGLIACRSKVEAERRFEDADKAVTIHPGSISEIIYSK